MKELEVAVPRPVYRLLVLLGLAVCGCSHKPAGKPLQMLWSTPIASSDRPVVSGNKLFIRGFHAGNPLEKRHLYALDTTTGKEMWASNFVATPACESSTEPLKVTSDGHLIVSEGGEVYVLDSQSGKVVAQNPPRQGRPDRPLVDAKSGKLLATTRPQLQQAGDLGTCWDGIYLFVNQVGQVCSYDLQRKAERWKSGPIAGIHDVQIQAGQVFLFAQNSQEGSTLTVLTSRDGKKLWSYKLARGIEFGADPEGKLFVRLEGSRVYVVAREFVKGQDGTQQLRPTLVALDAASGQEKWRYAPFSNALRIDSQGVWLSTFASIYGENTDFNALLDSDTGKEQWRHRGFFVGTPAGGLVWQSHHVAHMDFSKNYSGDKRGNKLQGGIATPESVHSSWLEGLDSESQRTVWQSEVSLTTEMSQPFVADSVIYVSSISEMKEGLSSVRAYRLPARGESVGSP